MEHPYFNVIDSADDISSLNGYDVSSSCHQVACNWDAQSDVMAKACVHGELLQEGLHLLWGLSRNSVYCSMGHKIEHVAKTRERMLLVNLIYWAAVGGNCELKMFHGL